MIYDDCLLYPTEKKCWIRELFKEGRLYLLRYPLPTTSPLETEPLIAEFNGKTLSILCSERHLHTSTFESYMEGLGASKEKWTTISFSNFESFYLQLLVLKKKRPEVAGLLIDPPKSSYIALSRHAGADIDNVLLLPERETIVEYLLESGIDGYTLLHLESSITKSIFK